MTNKAKIKGSTFERDAVNLLNKLIRDAEFKRIPGSGAIGTSMGEPLLCGDIIGRVKYIPKSFRVEAKAGYNNSAGKEVKQFTLKKEWLDKISEEADKSYSVPMLIGKFDNARSGVKQFIVLDVDTFAMLINTITELQRDLED